VGKRGVRTANGGTIAAQGSYRRSEQGVVLARL
jgi:hypothetical protein